MKKIFFSLTVILVVSISFPGNKANASIPVNSNGMYLEDVYWVEDFYPHHLYYDANIPFHLNSKYGKYLGKMLSVQDTETHLYGRTFAHSSTYYRWGKAMGGNPSYVRDYVRESKLERESDGRVFTRAHSRQLAESSGAELEVLFRSAGSTGVDRIVVKPTPYPTGDLNGPSVVNLNEDFTVSFDAREYYPYSGNRIKWELWFDDRFRVDSGTSYTSRITSKKIPLSLNGHGHRKMELRISDKVERETSITKNIYVNRPPEADFNASPNPTNTKKSVSFSNRSSDPDGDRLSYKYDYRKKGNSSWQRFSTATNPSQRFRSLGTYEVRLTATDTYGASDTEIKEIDVENQPPNANFTMSPNPTDRNTTVDFNDYSSDPENDSLTYQYHYRKKGALSWRSLSTRAEPSHRFTSLGTYEVRLRVTDIHGDYDTKTKEIDVENISPEVKVNYNPSPVYEGDDVDICITPTDEDKDRLKITLYIQKKGGSTQKVLEVSNLDSGTEKCHTVEDIEDGEYETTTTVTDGNDSKTVTLTFTAKELSITGHVNHTDKWEEKHMVLGNPLDHFYSGERFLLLADLIDYPVDYLNVFFEGYQLNSNLYTETVPLSADSPVSWVGDLYNSEFQDGNTKLRGGVITFDFEVKYQNGTIKRDTVNVEIIGDVYDVFQIKQKY
ncbi:PKD domain-containing protein [Halobacillus litoralis]|uniref:PKD domain-containing protein n=1 Tax=Halobacillus litoralis TaxID=45668 RepID=A0A410MJC0_9BACI|nr:PKD domain-containing protein [Halobacillus litoralis]QAS54827.1 hypothetical protein HLI_21480 [Halobacillus litoralis]